MAWRCSPVVDGEGEFRPESATADSGRNRRRRRRARRQAEECRREAECAVRRGGVRGARQILPRMLTAPAGSAVTTREADAGSEWLGQSPTADGDKIYRAPLQRIFV
jgi:hypothetical protein